MVIKQVVVDTSILIDHARGKGEVLKGLLRKQQRGEVELIVSTVVVFEFYSGLSLNKKRIFDKTDFLFTLFSIVPISKEIAKLAAKINRENKLYQKIGGSDLLIGAVALHYSAKLITKNKKDFKQIPGLKFY